MVDDVGRDAAQHEPVKRVQSGPQDTEDAAVKIDLLSPTSFEGGQPHGQFDWLRTNEPVRWHDQLGGLRAVRSYDTAHAIHEGEVVAADKLASTIERLLDDERAAYVHVHCAVNGCFTFRADRI